MLRPSFCLIRMQLIDSIHILSSSDASRPPRRAAAGLMAGRRLRAGSGVVL